MEIVGYDITNELGPKNWLDKVAGEAVILGHSLNDPYLVVKGTELSALIRKITFNDDEFCKVEALGMGLLNEIAHKKEEGLIFIDELYIGPEKEKSCNEWEYDLILADGRYQIMMILPEYHGDTKLLEPTKIEIEKQIQSFFEDPSFDIYRKEVKLDKYESQIFENTRYFDEEGREIRRTVDFNHEGKMVRGRNDFYYFDDVNTAMEAWQMVRKVFTLSQRK